MGIFSFLGEQVTKVGTIIKEKVKEIPKAIVNLSPVLSPVAPKVVRETAKKTIPIATGIGAGIVTKSPAVGISTAVGTGVFLGALTSDPTKTISAVAKAPSQLSTFTTNIGEFAVNPTMETFTDIGKESPILSTATALAGGIVATRGIVGLATAKTIAGIGKGEPDATTQQPILTTPQQPYAPSKAVTPETTIIEAGKTTGKKRRKATQKKQTPSVNQKVNILINNRSNSVGIQNKRYINERVLSI